MNRLAVSTVSVLFLLFSDFSLATMAAQPARLTESPDLEPPQIIYTSHRVVAYQLRRLSNAQLMRVLRDAGDLKYVPVYEAFLSRPALRLAAREEAIQALTAMNKSDRVSELLAGISRLDQISGGDTSVLYELAALLTAEPPTALLAKRTRLEQIAVDAKHALSRRAGFAAIVIADEMWQHAWDSAASNEIAMVDLIGALPLVPSANLRNAFFPRLKALILQAPDIAVGQAAIAAISHIPDHAPKTFALLAELIRGGAGGEVAVVSIGRIDKAARPLEQIEPLWKSLLTFTRGVPAPERDSGAFLEAMALASDLLEQLPVSRQAAASDELRQLRISARLIKTVEHQMLYDRTEIVVEAGKPVSLLFQNNDIMPHNLVVGEPGALESIGQAAEAMVAQANARTLGYVPDSTKVLQATKLLMPGETEKLSFTAPRVPGVYPYVCTYPGHWRRMFGAMTVVANLDAYHNDPTAYRANHPLPILDNLLKVNRAGNLWTFEQLAPDLPRLADGRSFTRARAAFRMASCVACHRLNGDGYQLGPDLQKLDPKLQAQEILAEILDPSKQINADFATHVFVLNSGKTIAGIILEETADIVRVQQNPLARCAPIVLQRTEIDTRQKSTVSMMPGGLLNPLTCDEILDLIAYVVARGDRSSVLFDQDSLGK